MPVVSKHVENCRVYVSGFPNDITEEDICKIIYKVLLSNLFKEIITIFILNYYFYSIDILFSGAGKVKKVKLYTDAQGSKKGDALVTYVSAESATVAAIKVSVGIH